MSATTAPPRPLIGVAAYGGIDQDGKPSSDPTWASYTLKVREQGGWQGLCLLNQGG
jgi:hypothetical protein